MEQTVEMKFCLSLLGMGENSSDNLFFEGDNKIPFASRNEKAHISADLNSPIGYCYNFCTQPIKQPVIIIAFALISAVQLKINCNYLGQSNHRNSALHIIILFIIITFFFQIQLHSYPSIVLATFFILYLSPPSLNYSCLVAHILSYSSITNIIKI